MVTHRITLRRIGLTIGASLMALGLLVACTRNRATPEPTGVSDAAVTILTNTTSSGGGEPLVTVVATIAPTGAVASAGTPAALTPKTIDYRVEENDTLALIAQKFDVELETIRQLNYLLDDNIFVGQILQIPYREGITAEGVPTPTPQPFSYVVEEGDSLGSIAQQFGVSAVSIMEENNLQNPNSVFIGQALIIPNYVPPSSNTSEGNERTDTTNNDVTAGTENNGDGISHVVQPGETLYGIAQKYGVDANAIADANNVANRNQLRVGQKLIIPGITAREAAEALGRVHIVQSGESLTAIAQQYGVTAEEIITFNNISNPDAIYVGQELIIPGQ